MALTLRDVALDYVVSLQDSPEQIVDLLMKPRAEQLADLRAYARTQAQNKRQRAADLEASIQSSRDALNAEATELEAV